MLAFAGDWLVLRLSVFRHRCQRSDPGATPSSGPCSTSLPARRGDRDPAVAERSGQRGAVGVAARGGRAPDVALAGSDRDAYRGREADRRVAVRKCPRIRTEEHHAGVALHEDDLTGVGNWLAHYTTAAIAFEHILLQATFA